MLSNGFNRDNPFAALFLRRVVSPLLNRSEGKYPDRAIYRSIRNREIKRFLAYDADPPIMEEWKPHSSGGEFPSEILVGGLARHHFTDDAWAHVPTTEFRLMWFTFIAVKMVQALHITTDMTTIEQTVEALEKTQAFSRPHMAMLLYMCCRYGDCDYDNLLVGAKRFHIKYDRALFGRLFLNL